MRLTRSDEVFLSGARIAGSLIEHSQVRDRWTDPATLPRMTVGMLACHLGKQLLHTRTLVVTSGDGDLLPSAIEHYRHVRWVKTSDLDDSVNDRSASEQEAGDGHEALCARTSAALEELEQLFAEGSVQEVVPIPWQGWRLKREDFLTTRLLEIVVHCDDLARSVDVPTPGFPDEVFLPVVDVLARLAAERHGQATLISALSRRERMPKTISAF